MSRLRPSQLSRFSHEAPKNGDDMQSQHDLLETAIPLEEKTDKDMNRKESCLQIEAQVYRRMGKEAVEEVDRLLRRIIDGLEPERIFLFGSNASGNATTESDIDLLIIKESDERPVLRRRELLDLIKGSGIPKDIFVMTPQEFEETKDVVGSIAYEASHYGKVVYG